MPKRRIILVALGLILCCLSAPGCTVGSARRVSSDVGTPLALPHKATVKLDELTPTLDRPISPTDAHDLPSDVRPVVIRAEKLIAIGKSRQAVLRLEFALLSAPDNARILRNLGHAYLSVGNRPKALEILERAARIAGDDLEIHFNLGRLYAANKQYDQGIIAFRTALMCSQSKPNNALAAESLLRLGNLLKNEGFATAAIECFTKLDRWIDQKGARYSRRAILRNVMLRPERLITERGRLLLQLGRIGEAADLLEKAFRFDRTHRQTARLLIKSLIQAKEFNRAESLLMEISQEFAQHSQVPKLAELLCRASGEKTAPRRIADLLRAQGQLDGKLAVTLARTAERLGVPDEARMLLESQLATMPGDIQAVRFLAGLYARQGKQEKALRLLGTMLMENPDAAGVVRPAVKEIVSETTPVDIERQFALTVSREKDEKQPALYYVAGQLAEALDKKHFAAQQYRSAISEERKFFPAYEALVDLYLSANQHERLDAVLQQLIAADEDGYFGFYLKGKVQFAKEDFLMAEKELSQSIARNEAHIPSLLLMGQTCVKTSRSLDAARAFTSALRLDPDNEEVYRMLFDVFVGNRRYKQGAQVVRQLLARHPDSVTGRALGAELAMRIGQVENAEKVIAELRKISPDYPQLPLLSIQLELTQRKGPLTEEVFQSMIRRVSELIRRHPQTDAPKRLLKQLFARQGKGKSREVLTVWEQLYEQTSHRNDLSRIYAALLLTFEQYDEAMEVLEHLVVRKPHDLVTQRMMLKVLMKLNRPDQAAILCRKTQTLLDGWIVALADDKRVESLRMEKLRLYALVGLYEELVTFAREWIVEAPANIPLKQTLIFMLSTAEGQVDKAHSLLDEWIAADGQNVSVYRRMKIALYVKSHQIDQAEVFGLRWIQSDPNVVLPRISLIAALAEADQLDRAQSLVDGWIDRTPTSAPSTQGTQPTQPSGFDSVAKWSREWSVWLMVMREEYDEAMRRLERYIPLDPKNEQLLVLKSTALAELKRPTEAIAAMEAAHRLRPESSEMQNNLGYLYADYGVQLDKAERLIRSALAEKPGQIAYQDSLGWVFYRKGKLTEAGRIFEQILIAPSDEQRDQPVILDHAADAMWRLGKKQQAVALWRQAVQQAEKKKVKSVDIRAILENTKKKIRAAESDQAPKVAPLAKEMGSTEDIE